MWTETSCEMAAVKKVLYFIQQLRRFRECVLRKKLFWHKKLYGKSQGKAENHTIIKNLKHGAPVSMYSKSLEKSHLYLTGKLGIAIVYYTAYLPFPSLLLQQVGILSDTYTQLIPLALEVESKGLLLRALLFRSCWSQLVDPEFEHLQQTTVLANSLYCT